jgi:hypothetical protein
MTETYKELVFLPSQEEPRVDSDQFRNMKPRLKEILEDMDGRDENAPTLRQVYECEDVTLEPLEYQ